MNLSPQQILELFRSGFDTLEIANATGKQEHEIYNLIFGRS